MRPLTKIPWVIALTVVGVLPLTVAVRAAAPAIFQERAEQVFAEAAAICARDDAHLWGRSLCGPMMLVDPASRAVVANEPDARGTLVRTGSVYVGTLPTTENLANTAIMWSGVFWTQISWPLPTDPAERHVLVAHEMFHRVAPKLDLPELKPTENTQLDALDGRYLLQLEWRALASALKSQTESSELHAITDALLFRARRYQEYPDAAEDEHQLELNEGLAEYTGVRLGLAAPRDQTAYALQDLSIRARDPSFVRSFAYATGPAYGLLLDRFDPALRSKLRDGRRFDQLLQAATQIQLPALLANAAAERAEEYDGRVLRARELALDRAKQSRQSAFRAKFVDGPVLALPLAHSDFQFDPRNLQPLDTIGTVYPTIRLRDDWGVLEARDGALIDKKFKTMFVSARSIDLAHLSSPGWTLALKSGWALRAGSRPGDYAVAKNSAGNEK